ncbi:hypothetical protein SKAU_G00326410 [Synaphobranchus kaupii]|uniref:G-protein coupled receptors family 1 profile domain-containing protein n=1 Tax=Synaphobranchus kaupii TaxID=118154 RepID=A0A9Q1EPP3_SYNKA|nr:hypothetical protein SKAU_G00326410 [Synaphobranchus kaupii]
MNNVTYNSPILLIEGIDVPHRFIYPVFALLLVIYLMILSTNIGVMLLIMTDRSLQQPMYLLLFNLSFNDILGNTVLLPRLMLDIVSAEKSISYNWCVSQAFFSHTYGTSCHTVMMIMAFDRYVAICHPLRYASIMSPTMVAKLTVSAWSLSLMLVSITVGLSVRLTRCRSVILNGFCDNPSLYKLSCQDVSINNICGLILSIVFLGFSMGSVAFTYFRILVSCVSKKNKKLNRKALQTCATHLVLYMIMLWSCFLFIIFHRLQIHIRYRMTAFILFHIVPANMNPIVYALQTKELKTKIVQILNSKVTQPRCRRAKQIFNLAPTTDSDEAGETFKPRQSNWLRPLLLLLYQRSFRGSCATLLQLRGLPTLNLRQGLMAEMENVSDVPLKQPIVFIVEGFIVSRQQGYPLFAVTLIVYTVMLLGNITVVTVIAADAKLHKPMYVLICNLAACDLLGGTVIMTQLMSHFLTGDKTISYVAAIIQCFCLQLYAGVVSPIMSAMAYDRYVAICKPLHYHAIMTTGRLVSLCFLAWFIVFCLLVAVIILTVETPLCGTLIKHVYCSNQAILRLACEPTPIQNMYYMCIAWLIIIAAFVVMTFTYVKILIACVVKQDKNSRSKAIQTCASHLIIYILFEMSIFIILVTDMNQEISPNTKKFCAILFIIIPPTVNPIIYGISMKDIRTNIVKFFQIHCLAEIGSQDSLVSDTQRTEAHLGWQCAIS